MTLFYIINELVSLSQKSSALLAVEKFKEAVSIVISDVGGRNNSEVARFFTRTITADVRAVDNTVMVPDGSSKILKVSVSGEPYTILPPNRSAAHGHSVFNSKSAVVDGNKITLYGLDSEAFSLDKGSRRSERAEIVVESEDLATIYVDGLYCYLTKVTMQSGGLSSPSYAVSFPTHQIFEDDSLIGGDLRLVSSADKCEDYVISGNTYVGRNLIFVKPSPSYFPASWIRFSEKVNNSFEQEDIKNNPDLAGIAPSGQKSFPAAVARTMVPLSLRPLALTLAKWKMTGNAAFHAEYQQSLQNWMARNAR